MPSIFVSGTSTWPMKSHGPAARNPSASMPSARAGEEHVAGDLLLHEPGVRLVRVERADDVVAVRPGVRPRLVLVVAVRLAVVDHVEPVPRPPLAVLRRREQLVDQLLVGVRRPCRFTNASTSSGVGGRPIRSKYRRRISVRRSASGDGDNPVSFSFARTKLSIGLALASGSRLTGTAGLLRGLKLHQSAGFAVAEPSSGHFAPWSIHVCSVAISAAVRRVALRRHPHVGVVVRNELDERAVGRLAGDDRLARIAAGQRVGFAVEPQRRPSACPGRGTTRSASRRSASRRGRSPPASAVRRRTPEPREARRIVRKVRRRECSSARLRAAGPARREEEIAYPDPSDRGSADLQNAAVGMFAPLRGYLEFFPTSGEQSLSGGR